MLLNFVKIGDCKEMTFTKFLHIEYVRTPVENIFVARGLADTVLKDAMAKRAKYYRTEAETYEIIGVYAKEKQLVPLTNMDLILFDNVALRSNVVFLQNPHVEDPFSMLDNDTIMRILLQLESRDRIAFTKSSSAAFAAWRSAIFNELHTDELYFIVKPRESIET